MAWYHSGDGVKYEFETLPKDVSRAIRFTEERCDINGRVEKTRMPFRVAAFFLGVLFVTFGLYQLLGGAANWINFGSAIFIALIGLQFVFSAFYEQWTSPFAWTRSQTVRQTPARFLFVESVSFGIAETENTFHTYSPKLSINPYSPPRNVPTTCEDQGPSTQGATLQALTQKFLDGQPFIHCGVVFFLDVNDDQTIHAALPLSSSSDILVQRNTNEALRVLPEFLSTLPNASSAVDGRNLVVRMISSYDHFRDEACTRIIVPWSTIYSRGCQPSDEPKSR